MTNQDDAYPSSWMPQHVRNAAAPTEAVAAAFDVYAASLSDAEWNAFVARTRGGGR